MKVAVVGAGCVGLATAVSLAHDGHAVTVVDAAPANGATYHAGGMLAPAAEVIYQQDPLFPLMQAAGKWYPELLEMVQRSTELPVGHRAEGTLVVASDRADAQHLDQLLAYQQAHGMQVERVTTRQARGMEPGLSPRIVGAVSIPGDHQVFPRQFAQAMMDAAAQLGAEFVRQPVTRVDESADGCVLTCPTHQVHVDCVIIANGLGAADLGGTVQEAMRGLRLRPVYGDIVRVKVPEQRRPLVSKVVRGFVENRPVYVIPRGDGTIAIGATTREDGRDEPQVGGVYDLLRDAIRLVPGLEECDLIEATAGARPGTPDDLPYLGRLSERVIVSTGYFRHGILLSSLAARVAVELVDRRPPSVDISACDPTRHAHRG